MCKSGGSVHDSLDSEHKSYHTIMQPSYFPEQHGLVVNCLTLKVGVMGSMSHAIIRLQVILFGMIHGSAIWLLRNYMTDHLLRSKTASVHSMNTNKSDFKVLRLVPLTGLIACKGPMFHNNKMQHLNIVTLNGGIVQQWIVLKQNISVFIITTENIMNTTNFYPISAISERQLSRYKSYSHSFLNVTNTTCWRDNSSSGHLFICYSMLN